MRRIEKLEGLAVLGSATVGPVPLRTPAVLDASVSPLPPLGPALSQVPSPSGERGVALRSPVGVWEARFPVLAPEVTPSTTGGWVSSDPTAVLVHAPASAETLTKLRSTSPELLVLGNARTLWNEGEPFARALRSLREQVGAEPLIWAPRVALPHRLPLLAYLGVDLLDTTEGLLRAAGGSFLDLSHGSVPVSGDEGRPPCDCAACSGPRPGSLEEHARALYRRSLAETHDAMRRGTLRELVEARLSGEPANAEHLRYADRVLPDLLEERMPVTGTGRRTYVLTESQRRPEMARFRDRLLARYRPPRSKGVLLLVPCSRTKPYRLSPSHRRFHHALEDLPGVERVHTVSVSSPLGLVPRELEDVFPARHYDVPVTGDWSAVEQEYVTRGLVRLLEQGRYRAVVLHLDPDEYSFLPAALPSSLEVVTTISDHRTTSAGALDRLRSEVGRLLAALPAAPGRGFRAITLEELASLAAFQFGGPAAERLLAPPIRLLGKPWFLRLTDGHNDLATVREERGLFHLTLTGAQRLGETILRVDADPAIALRGDLFVPGVRSAGRQIRVGDAVGIFQDDALAAVGEAALPGRLMTELRRGVAVKVRHHRHLPADTDMTEEPLPGEPGR